MGVCGGRPPLYQWECANHLLRICVFVQVGHMLHCMEYVVIFSEIMYMYMVYV